MAGQQGDPIREYIESYYDRQAEFEWARMDRHPTEHAVTLRALAQHLPPPPAQVLDCGGGPGRYAVELASRGYAVTLFDPSAENLDLAREKAAQANLVLSGYEHGTATDLSRFAEEAFDAVLLMGPLYHLLAERDRRQALAETRRVLRPGGTLFAAFISRYALPRYAAVCEPDWPAKNRAYLERLLTTGVMPPRGEHGSSFAAHYAHPTEVAPLCRDAGFEVVALLGVEGLVSMIEDGVNALSGEAWQVWEEINYRVASDPSILGCVGHLLAVAVKPRWRDVVRRIAQALQQAGIAYKVVGGTAAALHGVDVRVNDVDIETDAKGAYRAQELFAAHLVQPVSLREGEMYRSHLGQFDFEGLVVEVMGDVHRREREQWVPTWTQTKTAIELDGVPVCVSWLEEETLAYVRRGRLERAACCLPHCDRTRLLALLSGDQATSVI